MAAPPNNLDRLKRRIIFLGNVPCVELTDLPPSDNECYICQQRFHTTPWQLGGTLNRPVRLYCGHIVGFQCLARWMLSANFHNACPLCRVEIVHSSRMSAVDNSIRFALRNFEFLAVFDGKFSSISNKRLLHLYKLTKCPEEEDGTGLLIEDRKMVVYEELMEMLGYKRAGIQDGIIEEPAVDARLVIHDAQRAGGDGRDWRTRSIRRLIISGLRYLLTRTPLATMWLLLIFNLWHTLHRHQDVLFNAKPGSVIVIYTLASAINIVRGPSWRFVTFMCFWFVWLLAQPLLLDPFVGDVREEAFERQFAMMDKQVRESIDETLRVIRVGG